MDKGKGKKATNRSVTIVIAAIIIVSVLVLYYNHWADKTAKEEEAISSEQEELELLLEMDLEKDYPKNPRKTVETFSRILQALYSDIGDDNVAILAIKIRDLYDEQFLQANPQEQYLRELYTEISAANEAGRTISKYLLVEEDMETYEEIDGEKYATVYASYTISEKGKEIETKQFALKKDQEGRWKILGWTLYDETE